MLQDRGGNTPQYLAEQVEAFMQAAADRPEIGNVISTFRANVPQPFVDIDRTQVKTLDIPLNSVFSTLQAYLGSAYVNDFNEFGRTWQVRVQAGQEFRVNPDDIARLDVRNRKGEMIPIGASMADMMLAKRLATTPGVLDLSTGT